jgi:hypothetical protein
MMSDAYADPQPHLTTVHAVPSHNFATRAGSAANYGARLANSAYQKHRNRRHDSYGG